MTSPKRSKTIFESAQISGNFGWLHVARITKDTLDSGHRPGISCSPIPREITLQSFSPLPTSTQRQTAALAVAKQLQLFCLVFICFKKKKKNRTLCSCCFHHYRRSPVCALFVFHFSLLFYSSACLRFPIYFYIRVPFPMIVS